MEIEGEGDCVKGIAIGVSVGAGDGDGGRQRATT